MTPSQNDIDAQANNVRKISQLETNLEWIIDEQKHQSQILDDVRDQLTKTTTLLIEQHAINTKEIEQLIKTVESHEKRVTEVERKLARMFGGLAALIVVLQVVLSLL